MFKKKVIFIDGLHCKACEILCEDSLKTVKYIDHVKVNQSNNQAEIFYKKYEPDLDEIKTNLANIGYALNTLKTETEKNITIAACSAPTIPDSRHSQAWIWLTLGIIILYWLITKIPSLDFGFLLGQQEFSLSIALLIGLVAGVSTCLALTGGLVLGLAANYAIAHPEATRIEKFKPQLIFNLGRIIGFFILGGLLGLIGTTFKISAFLNGLLITFVGLVLLLLGLKLINILPALNNLNISFPKKLRHLANSNNSFLLGALTFFIPCGFTQAMQIYAISTGSFVSGGLTMVLFALGTAPGLLGVGGLFSLQGNKNNDSINNKKFISRPDRFFRIAGIIIVIFSLINLNNGFKLLMISSNNPSSSVKINDNITEIKNANNVQIINMIENSRGYVPNRFTITKGVPVRWIIDAQAPYSCASALIVPSLKISKQLKSGENIIEFTATKVGKIPFSCSMGMYTGIITVVEK